MPAEGSLGWLSIVFVALGCAQQGGPPLHTGQGPKLPVPVTVRFSRPGAQLDVLVPRGGPTVAHCDADCEIALPPGRYDPRVTGEGPNQRAHLDLRDPTKIRVRIGNSVGAAAGATETAVGVLAASGLIAGPASVLNCIGGSADTPGNGSCARNATVLFMAGAAGLALAFVGNGVLRANDTRIDIEPAPTAAPPPPTALFENAQGVEVRF
ncbi:MAG: hypothetical protein ABI548_05500 [Polyangiaceae bacterium]